MSENDRELQIGKGTPELALAAGTAYAREQAVRANRDATDEDIMWAKEARKAAEFAASAGGAARGIDDGFVVSGGVLMPEGEYRELLRGSNDFPVHPSQVHEAEKYAEALVSSFSSLEETEAVRQFPELEQVYAFRRESDQFAGRAVSTEEGREGFREMTDAVIVEGLRNGDIWDKLESRERGGEIER